MSMRDSSVYAGRFGRIVHRPLGLIYIEVEQDPPTGPILKRADRTVDLAYLVLTHSASLSAHDPTDGDMQTAGCISRNGCRKMQP